MKTAFPDVEAHVARLPEERARGDAFERVVAHYLRHDPVLGMRRVWTWLDWPGRQAAGVGPVDLGIDLVAEDERGELVGVQVKHRLDPHAHLRWSDVSTALGFRPDLFARRLIVTNAADRTANARKATLMTPNTAWVLRDDLLASPIDWTDALTAGSGEAALVRVKREPRPYQASAVADVVASLADNARTQLVMACGSGKTLVTLWVAEGCEAERVLVLVPTLLLLKQFRREWREAASLPFVDLAVCSDADTVEPDEWQVRADELGVPVTTDPAAIAAFLRGTGRRVIFSTYASSARVAEAQAVEDVPEFDLVVADEAHRIAGVVNTGVTRQRDQRVVLDADRIRANRRLFATATPRVFGRAVRARFEDLEDVEVASMDDETLFGPVAHRLWFREAVELGVLSDYQLVVVLVTDQEVEKLVRERAGVIVDGKVLDAETFATLIAIRRSIDDLGLTRAISFHHTIARARAFAHALSTIDLATARPDAEHISGAMSVDERERVLDILADPERPTVVTNARCLTEGIDVPSLDAIAFVDPRSSAVDIVQAVGRVMRRAPGKERGYVVVPVFLGEAVTDAEAAVESSAFDKVLDVLRALRAHDPDLTADATRIKASLGARDAVAGGHIADHIRLLGIGVDALQFERSLELRFVEVSAEPFELGLARLREFVGREGHANVPARHDERGFPLGKWVEHRRAESRRGVLAANHARSLQALTGWTWSPREDDWFDGLGSLQRFVARTGHANVPLTHIEGGLRLGLWVANRRNDHRRRELSPDRTAALASVPGWTWTPRADDWSEGLDALRHFADAHGHARPHSRENFGNFHVGRWVVKQRIAMRHHRLDQGRMAALEELPAWTWDINEDSWQRTFAKLLAYTGREGHARVPVWHVEDGVFLGRWVDKQRTNHRRGDLEPDRVLALEQVTGWAWMPFDDDWQTWIEALNRFVQREGHARVPQAHREGPMRLGAWVTRQRIERNAASLEADRMEALAAIPGWSWDPIEDLWVTGVDRLNAFVRREGHARVPALHREDGYPLGSWVASRRQQYRKGTLAANRVVALNAITGWTWDARRAGASAD